MATSHHLVEKTLFDHYFELGSGAHFLALSLILFVGILVAAFRHPRNFSRLLVPGSLFPLVAGIYGSASGFMTLFKVLPSSGIAELSWERIAMECMYPLVVGSFLSMAFFLVTLIVLFATSNARGNQETDGSPTLRSQRDPR